MQNLVLVFTMMVLFFTNAKAEKRDTTILLSIVVDCNEKPELSSNIRQFMDKDSKVVMRPTYEGEAVIDKVFRPCVVIYSVELTIKID